MFSVFTFHSRNLLLQQAKIDGSNLLIALEPESASLYCHHLPSEVSAGSVSTFQPGTKNMILDAGGMFYFLIRFALDNN